MLGLSATPAELRSEADEGFGGILDDPLGCRELIAALSENSVGCEGLRLDVVASALAERVAV